MRAVCLVIARQRQPHDGGTFHMMIAAFYTHIHIYKHETRCGRVYISVCVCVHPKTRRQVQRHRERRLYTLRASHIVLFVNANVHFHLRNFHCARRSVLRVGSSVGVLRLGRWVSDRWYTLSTCPSILCAVSTFMNDIHNLPTIA